MQIEKHPFPAFVPNQAKYLILGSFPGRESTQNPTPEDWYYGAKRNQFWKILSQVYQRPLLTIHDKKELLIHLNIAIADVILSCHRKNNSNLDVNLVNKAYNIKGIEKILQDCSIIKIFCTSRGVEKIIKRHFKELLLSFPTLEVQVLPSPSPRYYAMKLSQKVEAYKSMLPCLST